MEELQQKHFIVKLAELYQNEQGIDALSSILREKQHAAIEKSDEVVSREQAVKNSKKEHGRLNREQQHLEKEIR